MSWSTTNRHSRETPESSADNYESRRLAAVSAIRSPPIAPPNAREEKRQRPVTPLLAPVGGIVCLTSPG
jgi:hypothetical protein